MHLIRSGTAYFAIVFAVGFLLGIVRVLWLVPAVGERAAELLEMPPMIATSYLAARVVLRRLGVGYSRRDAAGMGLLALILLLALEFTLVLGVRGISLEEYFNSRDPVSAAAYALSLLAFALFPIWITMRGDASRRRT